MPHQIELRAERRTALRKGLGALRRAGYVPGNVYGPGIESTPIQVDVKSFESIVHHATPATMISLTIGSEARPRTVYLQKVQWQFVKHEPFHLDFYAPNLDRPMRSSVPLAFHGESPAAKQSDAMLLHPTTQVHVEALPADLPEAIVVDLSGLTEVDQAIKAGDLHLPPGVTLLDDPDELIAKVQLVPRAEPEVTEVPAAEAAEESAEDRATEGTGST